MQRFSFFSLPNTPFVKVLTVYIASLLLLSACHVSAPVVKTEFSQYVFSNQEWASIDSSIYRFILPYKTRVDSEMQEVIGYSSVALTGGQPESLLGNYVADLAMEEATLAYLPADGKSIDFCFLNNGGLRNTLPAGAITRQNVFELMPFENELVVLTLDGPLVQKILHWIAVKGGEPVSGLRMKIRGGIPGEVYIKGMPLDSTRTYKAVTSSYLANGGSNLYFLDKNVMREYPGLKIRDAVMKHTLSLYAQGQSINPWLDERIQYE